MTQENCRNIKVSTSDQMDLQQERFENSHRNKGGFLIWIYFHVIFTQFEIELNWCTIVCFEGMKHCCPVKFFSSRKISSWPSKPDLSKVSDEILSQIWERTLSPQTLGRHHFDQSWAGIDDFESLTSNDFYLFLTQNLKDFSNGVGKVATNVAHTRLSARELSSKQKQSET